MSVRRCVGVVLLLLMAAEILPCSWFQEPLAGGGGTAGPAFRFESLKVCDTGDSLAGVSTTHAFLVPAPPAIVKVSRLFDLSPDGPAVALEGFSPLVDRPPERTG